MPDLMIRCPTTGKPVYTGVTVKNVVNSNFSGNSFYCSECGQEHIWSDQDVLRPTWWQRLGFAMVRPK